MEESGVLKVRALDDGVDGAGLLAETTENALCHVDVVLGGSTRAVGSGLRLDSNSEGGASSLAKFAGNAAFLTGGVTAKRMLTSEHWRKRAFFPRVMQDVIGLSC